MTLMSRKVDYALLILSFLDQKAEGGCAREIADRYGLSKGFVANILSVAESCRQQGRNVLEFLTACTQAATPSQTPGAEHPLIRKRPLWRSAGGGARLRQDLA